MKSKEQNERRAQAQRERYATDQAYREKCKEAARKNYQAKKRSEKCKTHENCCGKFDEKTKQLSLNELCLIIHCLDRKAEQILKDFQEENGYLMGHDIPAKIDEMCNNLRNLAAVMRKVDVMCLAACESEAKSRAKEKEQDK